MPSIEDKYSMIFNAISRDKILKNELKKLLYKSGKLVEKLEEIGKEIQEVKDIKIYSRPDETFMCDYRVEIVLNEDVSNLCLLYCTRRARFIEEPCSKTAI